MSSQLRGRSLISGRGSTLQASVPVRDDATRIFPEAVRLVLDGKWTIEGRRFVRA